jgi:hypothetical protein
MVSIYSQLTSDMMTTVTLDTRFRFPDDHRFTPDRIATEYRMLIRGYLDQMSYLFGSDPKAQEIRDCATRIYELTTALSAHELQKHFRPPVNGTNDAIAAEIGQSPENVSRETPTENLTALTDEGVSP